MTFGFSIAGLIGLTIIITSGSIFENFRTFIESYSDILGKLVNCPMCTGFWVGFIYGLYLSPPSSLLFGGLISLLSWIIYSVTDYFATKSMFYAVKISKESNQTDNAGD